MSQRNEATDCTRLLHSNEGTDHDQDQENHNDVRRSSTDSQPVLLIPKRAHAARYKILVLTCIWVAFQDASDSMSAGALTEVLQDAICRAMHPEYYTGSGTNGPDSVCMDIAVQTELALILGWKSSLEQIPGIILALPFGVLANRIGRRPVLILSASGVVLSDVFFKLVCWLSPLFPIRSALFAPILQVIGGGGQVGSAIIFTMVVDAFSDEERVGAFFYLLASELASQTFGSLAGAIMMTKNSWIALIVSAVFPLVSLVVGFLLPETIKQDERQSLPSPRVSRTLPLSKRLRTYIRNNAQEFMQSIGFLWHNANLIPLLGAFFTTTVSLQSMSLILQYTVNKFGWSYAKASLLVTVGSFINLILVIFVLPRLDKALIHRYSKSPMIKDLRLCQVSGIFLTTGSLFIAISWAPHILIVSLIVFALGSSYIISLRSLTASLVPGDDVATLYSFLAIVTGTSALIARPAQAMIFHWSLTIGTNWVGLPYLLAGAMHSLSLIAIQLVSLRIVDSR